MTYIKTKWEPENTITASRLNHIEEGLDNHINPFTITQTEIANGTIITLDKTWNEIKNAIQNNRIIIYYYNDLIYLINRVLVYENENLYSVSIQDEDGQVMEFHADGPNSTLTYQYLSK